MIALLQDNHQAFAAACAPHAVFGAQLRTNLAVYGTAGTRAAFWLHTGERAATALGLLDSTLTIAGTACPDLAELSRFVALLPGCRQVTGPAALVGSLGLQGAAVSAPCMRYPGGAWGGAEPGIVTAISLDELYGLVAGELLGDQTQERERWCTHTSHLVRHELGFVAGIREQGELAATGGVYATGPHHGLIACLITRPQSRGRGYGAHLVRYLCDRLLALGKTPVLQCASDELARYYAALGFVPDGRWCKIIREGT